MIRKLNVVRKMPQCFAEQWWGGEHLHVFAENIAAPHKGFDCEHCGKKLEMHGLFRPYSSVIGRRICPGDWIVECLNTGYFLVSEKEFWSEFELRD